MRDRFTDLEKKLSLEIKFYKERADRKIYFEDRYQRINTGLSLEEFEYLALYLEPFASRFKKFDHKEVLNLLLLMIRQGMNFQILRSIAYQITRKEMTFEDFSLACKRALFILVGTANLGFEETWHVKVEKSFGKSVHSQKIGGFYRKYINLDKKLHQTMRTDGASTLAKGLSMTKLQLIDFISACDDRSHDEIEHLVENRLFVRDLVIVIDATYVMLLFMSGNYSILSYTRKKQKKSSRKRTTTVHLKILI